MVFGANPADGIQPHAQGGAATARRPGAPGKEPSVHVYLGLDIGTTHVKAMAWSPQGLWAQASRLTPWSGTHAHILDPDAIYHASIGVLLQALDGISPRARAAAIGIAGMGEAGLYIDGAGRPYGPIVGWQDVSQTTVLLARLLRSYDAAALFRRTGMSPDPKFGLLRMMAQRPEPGPQPRFWLQTAEWIGFRLTGSRATHASLAARTMAYNLEAEHWDDELLAWADVRRATLPEVHRSAVSAGRVRAVSARLDGAEAVVAGHDHGVAAYGAGLPDGALLNSSGTAETLVVHRSEPLWSDAARELGVMWQPAVSDVPQVAGIFPTEGGGAAELWARNVLAVNLERAMPHSSGHVAFRPHGFAVGRAAWQNIGPQTTADELYQAVLEGLAAHVDERATAVERVLGADFTQILATGGGWRHPWWPEVRRRCSTRPFRVMSPTEGVLLGALSWAVTALGREARPRPTWEPAD